MTSNLKHARRILAASLACLLLSPLASASVHVGGRDVDLAGASWGCDPRSYDGKWGYILLSGRKYTAHGWWTDGCGGRACDDSVQGRIRFGDGYSSFYVVETGRSSYAGLCYVRCTLDGASGYYNMLGNVEPDGVNGVTFGCGWWYQGYSEWFRGYLGNPRNAEVDVFVVLPSAEANV